MLEFNDIITWIAFGLCVLSGFHKNRKVVLGGSLAAFILMTYIFYVEGAAAAVATSAICALCTLINIAIPQSKLEATFRLRLALVAVLCVVAGCFTVRGFLELLPFISMLIARGGETLKSAQHVRYGYACGGVIWLTYVAALGNPLILALEAVKWAFVAVAIGKFEWQRAAEKAAAPTTKTAQTA